MTPLRPNRVELDDGAVAFNLAAIRRLLTPGTGVWQVCKGDGYGMGTTRAAAMGVAAGIDRFCAGTPEEALALRRAFPDTQVLLFPSALPGDLPALAAEGVTLSIHNAPSLAAVMAGAPGAACWVKVDCGLHRYGFGERDWPDLLAALRGGALPGLQGIYTHFGQSSGPEEVTSSLELYDRRLDEARGAAGRRLFSMVAASPLLMSRPGLGYDYVDPGRALYGMVPPAEAAGVTLRPAVASITSRLVEVRDMPPGDIGAVGYANTSRRVSRVGVMPLGHFDGLRPEGPLGTVLVRGAEAPVLSRTLLASIIDLTGSPEAVVGDEVVLTGRSRGRVRDIHDFAASLASTTTALHFGLVRQLPKTAETAG